MCQPPRLVAILGSLFALCRSEFVSGRHNSILAKGAVMVALRIRMGTVFCSKSIIVSLVLTLGITVDARCEDAPSSPGGASKWPLAAKEFLGTSTSDECRVYFTGAQSVVTEVFYPTLDQAQQTDLQFLVLDTQGTWGVEDAEERRQYAHVRLVDNRSLTWEVTTTAKNGKWRIFKRVFTDPHRSTLEAVSKPFEA
ncbi:hypothetical protein GC163_08155 [bacterium]|nr:hypothetical protein [bacterium]